MSENQNTKKTLHFEKIGRNKKTFDVQVDAACTLDGLCEEYYFLARQVGGCMMSVPDFEVSKDGKKIGVFAGWHIVGEAWFIEKGGEK